MTKAHHHQPRFVMGQYPVVATCSTCPLVQVHGGHWVTKQEAEKGRKRIGWLAAL